MRAELGPKTVGRIAGYLFAASGVLSIVTLPLPQPPGADTRALLFVSIGAIVAGAFAYLAPWDHWRFRTDLVLIPLAFVLIGLSNTFGSTRNHTYSVFFVVAFVWIGISHPRWTSLRFAPLAVAAYAIPIFARTEGENADAAGALFAIPVCVLVAEVLAWVVAGEQRSRRSAHALVRVASALGQHLNEAVLCQTIVDESREALDSDHAILLRLDPDSILLTAVFASAVDHRTAQAIEHLPGTKLPGVPPQLLEGDPLVVEDATNDPHFAEVLRSHRVKSYIAMPLLARNRLVGVLTCFQTAKTRRYGTDDIGFARALAAQASTAIENAVLYERTLAASRCDPLTGLKNRRAFRERLEAEVERARRYGRELSLIVLDVDHFKRINDALGHQTGDEALVRVGELLQRSRRMDDGAFRIGGDEFAVLLPETSAPGASTIAERLRNRLERAGFGNGRDVVLTASIGVASFGVHATNADDLFQQADAAMYEVKAAGRNAVALPTDGVQDPHSTRLGIDIEAVLAQEGVIASYQPIFDLHSGEVVGFELFSHLDPSLGATPTPTIFRAAAAAGRLDALDSLCRTTALRGVDGSGLVFLNVEPSVLSSETFSIEDLLTDLRVEDVDRQRVVIELTEHGRVSSQRLLRNLRASHEAGLRVALDHFSATPVDIDLLGSGFDYVKIDMSSVHETQDLVARCNVLRGLVLVASEAGARAIACGVENLGDLRLARDVGFEAAQGLFLREPASVPDLTPRPLRLLAEQALQTGSHSWSP